MSGVAGLRGVSASQDGRFTDKTKQLKQKLKFPKQLDAKIDFSKVNLEVIREWIAKRVTALLNGVEDDVLIGYIFEMLEQREALDPKELQVYLTGFLEKNTGLFMKELWTLLAQAQESPTGIPQQILDIKAEELKHKEQYQEKLQQQLNYTRSQKYSNKDEPHPQNYERHKSKEEGRRGEGEERRSPTKQSSFDLQREGRRRGPPQRESSFRQYKRDRSPSPPKYNRRKDYGDRYYSQYSSREFGRQDSERKRGSSPPFKKRYRSKSPSPLPRHRSSSRDKSPPRKTRQREGSFSPDRKKQQQQKIKYDSESGVKEKDQRNGEKHDGKNDENNIGENFRVGNSHRSESPQLTEGEKEKIKEKYLRENNLSPSPPTDKDQKNRQKNSNDSDLDREIKRLKKSRKEEKSKRKKHKKDKKSKHRKRARQSSEELDVQNVDNQKGDVRGGGSQEEAGRNKQRDINDIVQEMKSIVEVEDLEALRQKALRRVGREDLNFV